MEETHIRNCPSCGAAMECKLQNFSIGADGGGGLLTLLADQYEVDLYACPACGKVELYTAAFSPEPGLEVLTSTKAHLSSPLAASRKGLMESEPI